MRRSISRLFGLALAACLLAVSGAAQAQLASTATPKYMLNNMNRGQLSYGLLAAAAGGNPTLLDGTTMAMTNQWSSGSCVRIPDGLAGIPNDSFYYVWGQGALTSPPTAITLYRFHINTVTNLLVIDQTVNLNAYGAIRRSTPTVDSSGTLYLGTSIGVLKRTIGGTITFLASSSLGSSSYGVACAFYDACPALDSNGTLYVNGNGESGMDTYLIALNSSTMTVKWRWRPWGKDSVPQGPSLHLGPAISVEGGTPYVYTACAFMTAAGLKHAVAKLFDNGSSATVIWDTSNPLQISPNTAPEVSGTAVSISSNGDVLVPYYRWNGTNMVGGLRALTTAGAIRFTADLLNNNQLGAAAVDTSASSSYNGKIVSIATGSLVWLNPTTGAVTRTVAITNPRGTPTLDMYGRALVTSTGSIHAVHPTAAAGSVAFPVGISGNSAMVSHNKNGTNYLVTATGNGVVLAKF